MFGREVLGSSILLISAFFLFRILDPRLRAPRRSQSLLTLVASARLFPIGLRELMNFPVSREEQIGACIFYGAYVFWDLTLGLIFYPAGLGFLEGWLHHLVSGGVAVHCVIHGKYRLFAKTMIVELPTVLLSLQRVYPLVFRRPLVSRILFPTTFLVFRLLVLNGILYGEHARRQLSPIELVLGASFFVLNAGWWLKCIKKQWLNGTTWKGLFSNNKGCSPARGATGHLGISSFPSLDRAPDGFRPRPTFPVGSSGTRNDP